MLRRLIVLLASLGVWLLDKGMNSVKQLLGLRIPGTCVFLNYHTVTAETRCRFAAQMAVLAKVARPLATLQPQSLEDGVKFAAVTFDDAFRSFALFALPVLIDLQLPVLLFVPSDYLGRKSDWFDYGGENAVGEEVVSSAELSEMVSGGGLEIGSHSVTHRNMVELSEAEARAELRDSKEALEAILGRSIHSISFPYGSFGERELKLAREEGYTFCFSVAPHSVVSEIAEGLIGRVSVQPSDWGLEFRLKLLGAYRWLPWASCCKRRMTSAVTGSEGGRN
jgi:peptidoglycan/xylan/chitin deacetylase (PgdA/CDA1 family)